MEIGQGKTEGTKREKTGKASVLFKEVK